MLRTINRQLIHDENSEKIEKSFLNLDFACKGEFTFSCDGINAGILIPKDFRKKLVEDM